MLRVLVLATADPQERSSAWCGPESFGVRSGVGHGTAGSGIATAYKLVVVKNQQGWLNRIQVAGVQMLGCSVVNGEPRAELPRKATSRTRRA